jgi:type II secretory pathway component PulF
MLSHRDLAAWYTPLAQQLEAGVTLRDALASTAAPQRLRALGMAMAARIHAGAAIDATLRTAEKEIPSSDLQSLSAAAHAGCLPQVLHRLAARHLRLAGAEMRVVLACAYPLVLVHVGIVLMPILRQIDWEKGLQWNLWSYLRDVALLLVPLWIVLAGIYVLARRHSPALRAVALRLPATGAYLRTQALSDLSFTLGNLLSAGAPIGESWATAGLVTHSPALLNAADTLHAVVRRGEPPGPHLSAHACFPPDFIARYRSGETTGTLDSTLLKLSDEYQDTANRALTLAALLYPALVFLLVAAAVVYGVLSFYAGYLKMVTKLAE